VKKAIDLLLYSNVWVALCLAVLVLGVAHHYCISDCWLFAAFAFLGTFTTYTFHRMVRNRTLIRELSAQPGRIGWQVRKQRLLSAVCLVTFAGAVIIFFYLPVKPLSILLLGICGIVVLFYALPFPGTKTSLRSVPFLKNYWIVLVWVIVISIPLINRGKPIDPLDLMVVAVAAFGQIIPFDIRDLGYDAGRMFTVPQQIGPARARIFSTLLVSGACLMLIISDGFYPFLFVPLAVSIAGTWPKQKPSNLRYLELLWDGTLLLFGVYYYLLPCNQL
jgi:hypothetical protein